jgi:hypothetical protein
VYVLSLSRAGASSVSAGVCTGAGRVVLENPMPLIEKDIEIKLDRDVAVKLRIYLRRALIHIVHPDWMDEVIASLNAAGVSSDE